MIGHGCRLVLDCMNLWLDPAILTGPSELHSDDFISHCHCSTRGLRGLKPPTTIVEGAQPLHFSARSIYSNRAVSYSDKGVISCYKTF